MNTSDRISFSNNDLSRVEAFAASRQSSVLVIFFDDIQGSSLIKQELSRTHGEEAYQKLRREHDRVLFEIITKDNAGEVIKSTGDGQLAVFSEPTTAVERALEIQAYYKEHPYIRLRIGMDMGQVRVEQFGGVQRDMFGRHVDWASRAEAMSDGGHILVTESVYNDASDWVKRQKVSWKTHGYYSLKPGERPFALYEPYNANITQPMDHPRGNRADEPFIPVPHGKTALRPSEKSSGPSSGRTPGKSPLLKLLAAGMLAFLLAAGAFALYRVAKKQPSAESRQAGSAGAAMESTGSGQVQVLNILDTPIPIQCSDPQAFQSLEKKDGTILWTWKNKSPSFCGWFIGHLPMLKLTPAFINGQVLEIIYSGEYAGTHSPQVKFLGASGSASGLLPFSAYEIQGALSQKQVRIPLSDFFNGTQTQVRNMTGIQFDAGWDSPQGQLCLHAIRFIRKG